MLRAKAPTNFTQEKKKLNLMNDHEVPMAYGLTQVDLPNVTSLKINEHAIDE